MKRIILTITAFGAALLAAGCGSAGHPAAPPPPVHYTYSAAPSVSAVPATTVLPGASASIPPPPPPPPQMTVSQQQAVASAESYLSTEPGFSKAGLVAQLDSPYGGQFSYADALFAVNHVSVNWYQQAAASAHSYMQTEPGWSCGSLLQQLTSAYGAQFTQQQAEYGVHSVGLGYC